MRWQREQHLYKCEVVWAGRKFFWYPCGFGWEERLRRRVVIVAYLLNKFCLELFVDLKNYIKELVHHIQLMYKEGIILD